MTTKQMTPEFPICIRWPAEAPAAVVAGKWQRNPAGEVVGTYDDLAELEACIMAAEVLAEAEAEAEAK